MKDSIKMWRKWRDWRLEEDKIPMGFAGYKNYFDIIEKTKDNRMVILQKKKNLNMPRKLIEKYELISN